MSYKTDLKTDNRKNANLDPITDEPGAHPVGTGVGATLGGAASGAAAGLVAGPIGMIAGVAVGAIAGGLVGKAVAEGIDPTLEETYWRENYETRSYAKGGSFGDYGPAYNYGVNAYQKNPGRKFSDIEPDLERDWDTASADSRLDWTDARYATRDSFERLNDSARRGAPDAGNSNIR